MSTAFERLQRVSPGQLNDFASAPVQLRVPNLPPQTVVHQLPPQQHVFGASGHVGNLPFHIPSGSTFPSMNGASPCQTGKLKFHAPGFLYPVMP